MARPTQLQINCAICNTPVDLRTTKTNAQGKAVHEECYVLRQALKDASQPITDHPPSRAPRVFYDRTAGDRGPGL
jgi:hypothetical protein